MRRPMLELTRVSFRYGTRTILTDISFTVQPGQVVGLLGPNGSGKSTLVRLAAGLLRPHAGQVRLDGRDVVSLRRMEIAQRVAVLPQDAPLPETFTGWEVVLVGRTPHLGWLTSEGPADRAIARHALELVNAEAFAARRVGEISGGERQRLLLARALAQEPDVLLLDEPTVHLDLAHQLGTLDLVSSLARTAGLAVLGVFHEINLAAEYCDDLVLLRAGQVIAQGSPATTLTAELMRALYNVRLPILYHPQSGRPVVVPPAAGRIETMPTIRHEVGTWT
jgi:iron complex transport system ATP-binding protein